MAEFSNIINPIVMIYLWCSEPLKLNETAKNYKLYI